MVDEQNKMRDELINKLEGLSRDVQTGFEELKREITKTKEDIVHKLDQIPKTGVSSQ